MEKTNLRVEAEEQTLMTHDKKFIQIEEWLSKFQSENQEGVDRQAKRRNNMEGDGDQHTSCSRCGSMGQEVGGVKSWIACHRTEGH